jgi:hypothetical protein
VFAFNARSGPIPLTLLGCVGDICVWGQAAVRQGTGCWGQAVLWGRTRRHGPGVGLRGTWTALAGRRRGVRFSRCARGAWGVCLQCSLRPDPADAAGVRGGYLRLGTGFWDTLGDRLRGGAHWGYIGEPAAGAERLLLGWSRDRLWWSRDRLWWFRSSAALHSLWLTNGGLSNGGPIREFHWQTGGPVPDTSE